MLKHVGLQIIENDLEHFYVNLLGGNVEHRFTIPGKVINPIFHVNQEIDVCYINLDDLTFELFIQPGELQENFFHICLQLKNAKMIYQKAVKAGYNTYLRQTEKGKTFFIRDRNQNLFELKELSI